MKQNKQQELTDLRNRLKKLRQQIPANERDRGELLIRGRLFTWISTNRSSLRDKGQSDIKHIAAFWSMVDEPALQPLLRQLAQDSSLTISLPVVAGEDQVLAWRRWTPDTKMTVASFGIKIPEGNNLEPDNVPDIVLVPTLGYTRKGDRLGYGGGFYDRTIAAWLAQGHKITTVGVAWAAGDLAKADYQPQAHDIRLDSILTDKGWALPAVSL